MELWEYATTAIGGEARQSGVTDDNNIAADRCRKILRSYGVMVVGGIQF